MDVPNTGQQIIHQDTLKPITAFYRINCLPTELQITDFSFVRSGAVVADGLAKNLQAEESFARIFFFLRGRRTLVENGPKTVRNGPKTDRKLARFAINLQLIK